MSLSELDSYTLEENRKNLSKYVSVKTKKGVLELEKYLIDTYGLKYAVQSALTKLHREIHEEYIYPSIENVNSVFEEIKDKF